METVNQAAWDEWVNKNDDFYGAGVIEFAGRWANLMETKMADGEKLEDIAMSTSHEADTDGITGFMYGAAVQTLSKHWKYGEQLRRWHNAYLAPEQADEANAAPGVVLNPALVTNVKPDYKS